MSETSMQIPSTARKPKKGSETPFATLALLALCVALLAFIFLVKAPAAATTVQPADQQDSPLFP